jgi:DMSO/TMAO reductase YedYZ heme-binding membrane subunit
MPLQASPRQIVALKVAVFSACLVPAFLLAWNAWNDALGANPIEAVTRGLGDWTLNFLLVTLTVTPLRRYTGWAWLVRLRRMLGLFAFFYASLHVSSYLWFDQFFDWTAIAAILSSVPSSPPASSPSPCWCRWRRPRTTPWCAASAASAGRPCTAASI